MILFCAIVPLLLLMVLSGRLSRTRTRSFYIHIIILLLLLFLLFKYFFLVHLSFGHFAFLFKSAVVLSVHTSVTSNAPAVVYRTILLVSLIFLFCVCWSIFVFLCTFFPHSAKTIQFVPTINQMISDLGKERSSEARQKDDIFLFCHSILPFTTKACHDKIIEFSSSSFSLLLLVQILLWWIAVVFSALCCIFVCSLTLKRSLLFLCVNAKEKINYEDHFLKCFNKERRIY